MSISPPESRPSRNSASTTGPTLTSSRPGPVAATIGTCGKGLFGCASPSHRLQPLRSGVDDAPYPLTSRRGADERSREGHRWGEPAKLVLVQRQRTGEHQAMETRRRASGIVEQAGFAQRESEGDGPALFAEQGRVVTDREDRREVGGRGKRPVDLAGGLRHAPPIEHALGEVRWVREVTSRAGESPLSGASGRPTSGWGSISTAPTCVRSSCTERAASRPPHRSAPNRARLTATASTAKPKSFGSNSQRGLSGKLAATSQASRKIQESDVERAMTSVLAHQFCNAPKRIHHTTARFASSMKMRQTCSIDGTRFPSSSSRSNVNSGTVSVATFPGVDGKAVWNRSRPAPLTRPGVSSGAAIAESASSARRFSRKTAASRAMAAAVCSARGARRSSATMSSRNLRATSARLTATGQAPRAHHGLGRRSRFRRTVPTANSC